MKAIRRINNNVILCLDDMGNEFIARGKGIGFHDFPYEIDLSQIENTYYNVDKSYLNVIKTIPDDVILISEQIVEYASRILLTPISRNITFTLADHIDFAIKRCKEKVNITLPIAEDIKYLHEKEYLVGKYAVDLIRKRFIKDFPDEEAGCIALHIINAEYRSDTETINDNKLIDEIVNIIEKYFKIKINRNTFNYSRFSSHIHYLLKRGEKKELLNSQNKEMFKALTTQYVETYNCVCEVSKYIENKLNFKLSKEEIIYLILHINRLCVREECYQ